uniref:16S rRNA (uracil(1498)-N(3))-methyltransferase n=1 Tax=Tetradesmus obliquus TaxID=3088 RepID=A0A383W305_TETOB|eukprot:jgi/Sobl393_1/18856/SZX72038.1
MLSNTWINAPAVRQRFLVLAGSSTWLLQQQQQHSKQTVRCRHSAPHQAAAASPGAATAEPQQQQTAEKQLPRFYAPQLPTSIGAAVQLEPEEARHAVKVLRLKQGDAVELCDGKGSLVQCEVAYTDRSSATVIATSAPAAVPWQGPQWVVAAACLTLKGGRTDWLIEKATELGAYALLPLVTERSRTGTTKSKFKSLSSKGSKQAAAAAAVADGDDFQPSRLQRLALAATKQSLRAHGLQLLPVTQLSELLPQLQQAPVSLVATAGGPPVLQALQQAGLQQHMADSPARNLWQGQRCYLLVGPEGDFTPAEVQGLADARVLPVGLGSNRLRTETAAMALLSAAVLFLDAFQSEQQ